MKKQIKDVISAEFKGLWGTDFSDDGIPVIKTNNMTYEGRIDYSDICLRNITSEEAEENFLCNGDLIIEKSGGTKTHSVGYVNIFEGEDNKYVCNNFILPIRPNRDLVNPKYLFWQLHGMYEAGRFSDCFNKTTGIQNLQKKTYFSKEINVPTLPEQQKIAAHLDSIQSAIDNKKQQLRQLDELVKSKFVEMFGDPVENEKNWECHKLGALGTFKNGLNFSQTEDGTEIKYLGVADFKNNFSISNNQLGTVLSNVIPSEEYYLKNGDIVFVRSNGNKELVGRCVVVYPNLEKIIFSGFCIRFRLNENQQFNVIYLASALKTESLKSKTVGQGANVQNLNQKILTDLEIPIPSIELQNDFAEYVQKIDSVKSIIKNQLVDLQELLDSKMDEYFGE